MKIIDCILVLYVRGYFVFFSVRIGEVCFRWFRRVIFFYNFFVNNLYLMLIFLIEGEGIEIWFDRDVWDLIGVRW